MHQTLKHVLRVKWQTIIEFGISWQTKTNPGIKRRMRERENNKKNNNQYEEQKTFVYTQYLPIRKR